MCPCLNEAELALCFISKGYLSLYMIAFEIAKQLEYILKCYTVDFVEVITPLLRFPLMAVLIQRSRVFRGSVNSSDVLFTNTRGFWYNGNRDSNKWYQSERFRVRNTPGSR